MPKAAFFKFRTREAHRLGECILVSQSNGRRTSRQTKDSAATTKGKKTLKGCQYLHRKQNGRASVVEARPSINPCSSHGLFFGLWPLRAGGHRVADGSRIIVDVRANAGQVGCIDPPVTTDIGPHLRRCLCLRRVQP